MPGYAPVRQGPLPMRRREEEVAIMRRIVARTYADPVRYAARIELFGSLGMTREDAMDFVRSGPVSEPGGRA